MRDTADMVARTPVLMGLVWLAGALTATGIGIVAVQQVARSVSDQGTEALSVTDVQQALASVPTATSPTESPRGRPSSARPAPRPVKAADVGRVRTVTTAGGRVVAQCRDGSVNVIYSTPANGYRSDRTTHGGDVIVRFIGSRTVVEVTLTCERSDLQSDVRTRKIEQPTTTPSPARPTPVPTVSESPDDKGHDSPEPSETAEHSP